MNERYLIILFLIVFHISIIGQYTMQDLTVIDCEGTLTDSESNGLNPTWYSQNENYNFTICPPNALQITIDFSLFSTEPINDYVVIYDGPNNTYPILAGPFSGTNLPPQITSNGCITIQFISDQNVNEEGFELSWETNVSIPSPPNISIPLAPTCSTTVVNIELDQAIHCDSVKSAQLSINGPINQLVSSLPINCINDSTNNIQINLNPGLNNSGNYNLFFQSFFMDDCNNIWELSNNTQFIIDDCPLNVNIVANNTTICFGECTDLYVNVSGGDSTSYFYDWLPAWNNSPGIQTVCPTNTTQYIVTVSDNSSAIPASDTITINVANPPVAQSSTTICQTDSPIFLTAVPNGGIWSGLGIINQNSGLFSPNGLPSGSYDVNYHLNGCQDNITIDVLEINAGEDISTCINSPTFNLNNNLVTAGGNWSGNNLIQSNGDINVGGIPTIITGIYTLPNGCTDTLSIEVVNNISMPQATSICQQSGNFPLSFFPNNGIWSTTPDNQQLPSLCSNPIQNFPHLESWELGLNNWIDDPNNDFNWSISSLGTPSANTGPQNAYHGFNYLYTEASNPNHPEKTASIISPCINISEFNNPVLNFWLHKFGAGQGSLAIDISTDNGNSWVYNHWYNNGDMGNQWKEVSVNLSNFNVPELRIRFRVKTGSWQSDVAIDNVTILGGPITINGNVLTNVANAGLQTFNYSIEGCNDSINLIIDEINAGDDDIRCPSESPFNLLGYPSGGIWSGNNITNNSLGSFDPSLGNGTNIITYSMNGCIDTVEIVVINTNIQIDTLYYCINDGIKTLNMNELPRTPWNGICVGSGIISNSFPPLFNPQTAGVGIHKIYYEANSCIDSFFIHVIDRSILFDTLICSSSPDFILNASPSGGTWHGNGIINSSSGLFSPSIVNLGNNYIIYNSPSGCIDTFILNIYDNPILKFTEINNYYCFKDTNINIGVDPLGGTLIGNGINNNNFNPSLAGSGYHNIFYSYGNGNCLITIDTIIFVESEMITSTYQSKDTICTGELINIGVNVSGGTENYEFIWNNNLGTSFNHLVSPNSSIIYTVTVSDGCSQDAYNFIEIFVHSNFQKQFSTSDKKCYGEIGFATINIEPEGNYYYNWSVDNDTNNDTIYAQVNKTYSLTIIDNSTNCQITDTITIPGYDRLTADFIKNTTECIILEENNLQLINNSIFNPSQLTNESHWNFGDGNKISFDPNINPTYVFSDTGTYDLSLILKNPGNCTDTAVNTVCVISNNNMHIPNSFSPNNDGCNDYFYIVGQGYFSEFSIEIYDRWGSNLIFESQDIKYINTSSELNNCNDNTITNNFYQMGIWDGNNINGSKSPLGMYIYKIKYLNSKSDYTEISGKINLIR